jgi:hypothetical protein
VAIAQPNRLASWQNGKSGIFELLASWENKKALHDTNFQHWVAQRL